MGILGGNRTPENVKQLFRWIGQKENALRHVKDCENCQRSKQSNVKPYGLFQLLQIPSLRWESVSRDFIRQLTKPRHGHDAIVGFVDRLSKMVHLAATTSDVSAADSVKMCRHEIFNLHGLPRQVVSDRGTRSMSHFWREVM